ncbi:MAG: alpha-ribazole phosphatase [Omnitrophica bacterium RIFCSPHIGHO2_02_FULL_49_9]|nr:MAG: alpha-ribazole phosphatase [Omnitrophica bacterium RIFCSPHIGHO2_02_FULL_49_9]
MKLILIRHGETEWVREGRYQGTSNVPLNQRGFSQGKALARALKCEKPVAIYSSELSRARDTARLIAAGFKKRLRIDKRLNEVSFGDWEGSKHSVIYERFPRVCDRWYRGVRSSRPPGGESLSSLERRIGSFLNETTRTFRKDKDTVIVVAHGGPIRMFLVHALNLSLQSFWSLRVDPASMSMIRWTKHVREVSLLNSQAHLDGLMSHRMD